ILLSAADRNTLPAAAAEGSDRSARLSSDYLQVGLCSQNCAHAPASIARGPVTGIDSIRSEVETTRRSPRQQRSSSLEFFFRPRSIVLIGATGQAGTVGRMVFENL